MSNIKFDFVRNILNNDDSILTLQRLITKVKQQDSSIPIRIISDVWRSNDELQQQQRAPTRKERKFNTSYTSGTLDTLQFDIMYLPNDKRYIVTCMDVHSRKVWYRIIKKREKPYIIDAIKQILAEIQEDKPDVKKDSKIKNVRYDNEFNKKDINDIFVNEGTTVRPSKPNDEIHQGHIERFHRTLRQLIRTWQIRKKARNVRIKNNAYVNNLTEIIDDYNNDKNRITKNTPNDIFDLKEANRQHYHKAVFSFQVGDKVRLLIKRNTFDKRSSNNTYSKEKYIITRINSNNFYIRKENRVNEERLPVRGNELIKTN
jgi:hypothetical protein